MTKSKKRFYAIILLMLAGISTYSQKPDFQWAVQGGGNSTDSPYSVYTDHMDNIYVTGSFYDNATFGSHSISSNGLSDIFVAKYNAAGDLLWINSGGGSSSDNALSVCTDQDLNVYVNGYYSGTATFNGKQINSKGGSRDIFIAKYNPQGQLIWIKSEGSASLDYSSGMCIDDDGQIVVTGSFYDSTEINGQKIYSKGITDLLVLKYDSSGANLWTKNFPSYGYGFSNRVCTDKDLSIYFTGYFSDSIEMDGHVISSSGSRVALIAKLTKDGAFRWAKPSEGSSFMYGLDIKTDKNANVYATGYFNYDIKFGSKSINSNNISDIFLIKFDSTGNLKWLNSAGGTGYDQGVGLFSDQSGNTYITGHFRNTASFGSHSLTSTGDYDMFVAKCDPNGSFDWVLSSGGSLSDKGKAIALDSKKRIILSGSFSSSGLNFGATTLNANSNSSDVFLCVLGSSSSSITITEDPQDTKVCENSQAIFTVHAIGNNLKYQWQKNGTSISGANDSIYQISNVQASDSGAYSCQIKDDSSSITSQSGQLSIGNGPLVSKQPKDQNSVVVGQDIEFEVIVSGVGSLGYQWQKNQTDIYNETNSTLELKSVQQSDAGKYRCVITDDCGMVTSQEAVLNVNSSGTSTLTSITSLRLYEHHSPTIASSTGANGKQSGYDFVNNTYYNSFDQSTFSGWQNGEESNIDMVEHNGHATTGGDFGFTSGNSTIWGGAIRGNALTKYMIAPATFDYSNASDASEIFNVYNENSASLTIEHVSINDIYLAQIRGSNLYVAIKIVDVVNDNASGSFQDQYFDFEYKYGTYSGTKTISTDSSSLYLNANAGNTSFYISSNTNWTVTSNRSWLSFNPSSGEGDASINVLYDANTSIAQRNALIEASNGSKTVSIVVTQKGKSSGIDEQFVDDFSIYPNPVTSTLTINCVNFTDESKIKIIDLTGKLLLEFPVKSSSTQVNLDQLASGLYLLEWDLENGKTIKKKLIKK